MPLRPANGHQARARRQQNRPEFELAFGKNQSMKCYGWRGFFLALAVVLAAVIVTLFGAWVIPSKSSTMAAQLSSYFGTNQPKH